MQNGSCPSLTQLCKQDLSDEGAQLMYTIYVGITFIVTTPFAVRCSTLLLGCHSYHWYLRYVDSCGRRALLLGGGLGMTGSLALLAVANGAGW